MQIDDEERELLRQARAAVAARFPTNAKAIERDSLNNWDRGELIQAELQKLREKRA